VDHTTTERLQMNYRRKNWRTTDAPATRRRVLTYSNVASTVAVVLALGAGTAYAAHKFHYLLNTTKQINPSLLTKLKGNAGPAGPKGDQGVQGVQGIQGIQGVAGNTGPQGPGADVLVATLTAGSTTTQYPTSGGVGSIPVFFACSNEGSGVDPAAELETTATSGTSGSGLDETTFGGTFFTSYSVGTTFGTFQEDPETQEWDNTLGDEEYLAQDLSDTDALHGSVLIDYESHNLVLGSTTTETVDFAITEAGTGSTATCTIDAQVVFGSESSDIEF
jgi:hypothetical protein